MKYGLSVCAIVRDEAPYFREWFLFHLNQGVEKFTIYHNSKGSGDDEKTRKVLIETAIEFPGKITLQPWPQFPGQMAAYTHYLEIYGYQTDWCAFIDVDEFLHLRGLPIDSTDTVASFLNAAAFENVGGLAVHWLMFGSSGLKDRPDHTASVINDFVWRIKEVNPHVKSIVRPRFTVSVGNDPHHFLFKNGYGAVDENLRLMSQHYATPAYGSAEMIAINHYHTKSYAEYYTRKKKNNDAGSGRVYSDERIREMFHAHDKDEVLDEYLKSRTCLYQ